MSAKDYELHDDQLQYLAEQARRATASDIAVIVVRKDGHTSTGITATGVPGGAVGHAQTLEEALAALLGSAPTVLHQASRGEARLLIEVDGRQMPVSGGEVLHKTVRMTPMGGK